MSSMVPEHIAIIMDGNGRWAKKRGFPRIEGHRVGSKNVRTIGTHASNRGVKVLTLYAFSHENWTRPSKEVQLLMGLLKIYAIRERAIMMKENIRLTVIGDLERIPAIARKELLATIELTKKNSGMNLQLALSYGGRREIVRAVQYLGEEIRAGKINPSEITESDVSKRLYAPNQLDPDLIIRTGGERRLSNFLLWQSAYSEFYFTEKFWPEFSPAELDLAIDDYKSRERRFGGLKDESVSETISR